MKIEISNGDLVDKVSILEIKLARITQSAKLANVEKEYTLLRRHMISLGIDNRSKAFRALKAVNVALWEVEDQLRRLEQQQDFGDDFIALARSVYLKNDTRAAIKREINLTTHSLLIEEKEYVDYRE